MAASPIIIAYPRTSVPRWACTGESAMARPTQVARLVPACSRTAANTNRTAAIDQALEYIAAVQSPPPQTSRHSLSENM